MVALELLAEVFDATFDVVRGVVGIGDVKFAGGAGHELHHADGAGVGAGVALVAGFDADDGVDECGVYLVFGGKLVDELFVLCLAGFEVAAGFAHVGGGKRAERQERAVLADFDFSAVEGAGAGAVARAVGGSGGFVRCCRAVVE